MAENGVDQYSYETDMGINLGDTSWLNNTSDTSMEDYYNALYGAETSESDLLAALLGGTTDSGTTPTSTTPSPSGEGEATSGISTTQVGYTIPATDLLAAYSSYYNTTLGDVMTSINNMMQYATEDQIATAIATLESIFTSPEYSQYSSAITDLLNNPMYSQSMISQMLGAAQDQTKAAAAATERANAEAAARSGNAGAALQASNALSNSLASSLANATRDTLMKAAEGNFQGATAATGLAGNLASLASGIYGNIAGLQAQPVQDTDYYNQLMEQLFGTGEESKTEGVGTDTGLLGMTPESWAQSAWEQANALWKQTTNTGTSLTNSWI